jgi:hypothetical protein
VVSGIRILLAAAADRHESRRQRAGCTGKPGGSQRG